MAMQKPNQKTNSPHHPQNDGSRPLPLHPQNDLAAPTTAPAANVSSALSSPPSPPSPPQPQHLPKSGAPQLKPDNKKNCAHKQKNMMHYSDENEHD